MRFTQNPTSVLLFLTIFNLNALALPLANQNLDKRGRLRQAEPGEADHQIAQSTPQGTVDDHTAREQKLPTSESLTPETESLEPVPAPPDPDEWKSTPRSTQEAMDDVNDRLLETPRLSPVRQLVETLEKGGEEPLMAHKIRATLFAQTARSKARVFKADESDYDPRDEDGQVLEMIDKTDAVKWKDRVAPALQIVRGKTQDILQQLEEAEEAWRGVEDPPPRLLKQLVRLARSKDPAIKEKAKETLKKISSPLLLDRDINTSMEELQAGRLTWQHLEIATRALHRDGLVILEDVIDHSKLDSLNERMLKDAHTLQLRGDNSPYNYNKGNIQQDPPLTSQYFDPSIFLNPLATQVTSSVLGPLPRLSFISGNTALPPTNTSPPMSQPTHSDADIDHPVCPFALVINVPLVEMTPENGSTEVWLGTHNTGLTVQKGKHGERASGMIKLDVLEARRKERGPSQPVVKKGSIIIRDLRLWHGGKPNLSTEPRVMLAFIHFAPWYRNPMTVEFSEELKPILQGSRSSLQIQSTFLPEAEIYERYLNRPYGNAYDFDQVDRVEGLF
ncbi:hypothetical protein FRB96_007800 [Tulasnella sp. 330]|nr:hypothetical protein FRB96_007800 [Tulasnella sp. 330]